LFPAAPLRRGGGPAPTPGSICVGLCAGKDCYDECESAGPCNFCGPSGACCQDGHEGLGCKAEGNPCGAEAFCCTADTNLDNLGVPIPEYICVNGTVNGETGVNATNCNATVLCAFTRNNPWTRSPGPKRASHAPSHKC